MPRTAKEPATSAPNPSVTQPRRQKPAVQKPKPTPAAPAGSLEERRAKARQRAKERRAAGELPRSGSGLMDSTEHASLMKPYYLNDD